MSAPEPPEPPTPFERALQRARARHLEGTAPAAGDGVPDLAAIRTRIERPAPPVRRWPRFAVAALAAGALIALVLRVAWPAKDVQPDEPVPIAAGPEPAGGSGAPPEHRPAPSANTELVAERVRAALSDVAARAQPADADPLLVRIRALDEALGDLRAEGWPIARWVERARDDARLDAAARLLANDYLALRGDRTQVLALPSGHRLIATGLDSDGMRALCNDRDAALAACSELERAGPARAAACLRRVLETLPERRLGPGARDELLSQLARCGAPGARALLELSLSSSVAHEALQVALLASPAAHEVLVQSLADERARAIEPRFHLRCLAARGVSAA
ncbi:MAG: hypothetical protein FJ299_13740, partial [Planctomycetes bacterium]|nr:hypothetical protein [Planctomycetota bacterium]